MSIEEEYKKNNMDVQQQIRLEIENIKKGNSKIYYGYTLGLPTR